MPSKSKSQQKLFATALSVKRGDTPRNKVDKNILDIVDSMSEKQIMDFASTPTKNLPIKKEELLRNIVKHIIKEELNHNSVIDYTDVKIVLIQLSNYSLEALLYEKLQYYKQYTIQRISTGIAIKYKTSSELKNILSLIKIELNNNKIKDYILKTEKLKP